MTTTTEVTTTSDVTTTRQRSFAPLVFGLVFVALGSVLLLRSLGLLDLPAWRIWTRVAPALLLLFGLWRLALYFFYTAAQAVQQAPRRGSLVFASLLVFLSGSWLFFGGRAGVPFIGRYWPVVLIFIGVVKMIDYYRLEGRFSVRVREVFGVVFLIIFGMSASRAADAHWRLVPFDDLFNWNGVWSLNDFHGPSYSYTDEQSYPWKGQKPVIVHNAYGSVRINPGGSDRVQIFFKRQIYRSAESDARLVNDKIRLIFEETERGLEVRTNRDQIKDEVTEFKTDLEVTLPENFPIEVHSSYGGVQVHGRKAATRVMSSFGAIDLNSITGDVDAENKGARIDLRNVVGNVTLRNRNSEIVVEDVRGLCIVENFHGRIRASALRGDARLKNNYAKTELDGADGKVEIDAPGGSVDVRNTASDVTIRGSHRQVDVTNLRGTLDVQYDYGRIEGSELKGNTSIRGTSLSVQLSLVDAPVTVKTSGSSVTLEKVSAAVTVETTHKKISISDFEGPVQIANEYGDVQVESRVALRNPVTISQAHGDVTVRLADRSGFRVEARTDRGDVKTNFENLTEGSDGGAATLTGAYSGGGPLVKVNSRYGDIQLDSVDGRQREPKDRDPERGRRDRKNNN
ncbi:MAG: DUF4097 family beta strand repeat-containing protein [Acidobacteriota bacterium]